MFVDSAVNSAFVSHVFHRSVLRGYSLKAKWFVMLALLISFMGVISAPAMAARDYVLGPGDLIRISVFQNPELTQEVRVSDQGEISYPLIGSVRAMGLTTQELERQIAEALRSGGFLLDPQVTVLLMQVKGNQATVLGFVRAPGKIPLEQTALRVTDVIAMANGMMPEAGDILRITGVRDGLPYQRTVDFAKILKGQAVEDDVVIMAGDVIYVPKAAVFFIYGEVQRPGAWRVERDMTLRQALATAGGLTAKGTLSRREIRRRDSDGNTQKISLDLEDIVQENDVILIKESWF